MAHPPICHCLADGVGRPKADAIRQAVPPDMQLLELTLDTPAENVALDEALLLTAEAGDATDEVLRIWEPRQYFVVLGSSSRIASEVNREYCHSEGIEVVRRTSGGAAIVAGPGCLVYSLVLSLRERPELQSIDRAHRFVLDALATMFDRFVPSVTRRGTSDLAIGDRKFSGNSLRLKRRSLLYHGTLLYDFPLELIGACLAHPPREPGYRESRGHGDFLTNLPLDGSSLRSTLASTFGAANPLPDWPRDLVALLATEKFAAADWTNRL
jgi:lipoate---protein ligase